MADLKPTAGGDGGVHKAICTICFEDVKPIVEDLQTLPICGHVFHELCIQQWFEYCPAGRKPTCPVCKQSCSRKNITRLYFQSTGDSSQLFSPLSMQVLSNADAQALAEEVRKLEGKLAMLTAAFENQQVYLKKVEDELDACKQLVIQEELSKDELKKEKEHCEQLLYKKMEELSIKTLECAKLQERSLTLAKELASIKLATDLNLDEEEMVKLAYLGHGSNTENAVDVLRKSLARRNKSYKELMVQCNIHGRSETRAYKKLDMANEKINKLKLRLQEVEKALEEKENEVLRDIMADNKLNPKQVNLSYIEQNIKCPTMKGQAVGQFSLENPDFIANISGLSNLSKAESTIIQKISSSSASAESNYPVDRTVGSFHHIDLDSPKLISESNGHPTFVVKLENGQADRDRLHFSGIRSSAIQNDEAQVFKKVNAGAAYCKFMNDSMDVEESASIFIKRKVAHADMKATSKIFTDAIQKEAPSTAAVQETQVYESPDFLGNPSFSFSLGSEAANRSTGRWCRQSQSRSCNSSGDLIVVGADGRGGRIKVLKSQDLSLVSKRLKQGSKQRSQFNMEHFFEKTHTH